jgi:hypothetical protein
VGVVEIEILSNLHRIGFKLIPLCQDGKTPNVSGLLISEEYLPPIIYSVANKIWQ